MGKPTVGNRAFTGAVRLFVERHVALGQTLVQLRRESGDEPPGASSLKDLLRDLKEQLADAKRPKRVEVVRLARSCSTPIDVGGETYRSPFHAVADIAKRVLLARYNDDLAPLAILVGDLHPKSGPGGPDWNEVRESIVHQADVGRIHRHLTRAAERIDDVLAGETPEPAQAERETNLWWARLSLLGRGSPSVGGKAMWRRLSTISHEKSKTTFSYDESFATSKPVAGWSGAHRAARKRLKKTLIDGKPILGGGRGRHILNWRLPKWFVAQLDCDYPVGGP